MAFSYGLQWLTGTFAPNGFLGWNSFAPSPGPAWQINAQAPVPEPLSASLIGFGIVALLAAKRMRKLA